MPNSLAGLDSPTFNENTVNATPQLLAPSVTFTAASASFNGGTLTVSGLLAEDRVSIASGTTIYLSGGVVYYDADGAGSGAAVAIGTASGGSGSTFTVTFNADASAAAIDALIESLTYGNVSETPTASRTLTIDVTDADGASLPDVTSLTQVTGPTNPFSYYGVIRGSSPTLFDMDGDGDLDVVTGNAYWSLSWGLNPGNVVTAWGGGGNVQPSSQFSAFAEVAAAFGDLNGDGKADLVIGDSTGRLRAYLNIGTASSPSFLYYGSGGGHIDTLYNVDVGDSSVPTLGDLDGDGDLDMLVGSFSGSIAYFENTSPADRSEVQFTQRTGAANPLNGAWVYYGSTPTLVDWDADGDLDLFVGDYTGDISYFENTGSASTPTFTRRTGSANPFNGVNLDYASRLAVGDLDNDGDLDGVLGMRSGAFAFFQNTTRPAGAITVNVSAQNDAPTANGLPSDVTITEDTAGNLDLSAATLADLDGDTLTVVLTASAGTLTATSGGGVTVTNSGTGAITLTGTASDIDTFLNTASAIQYTGGADDSGDNAATITVTADDGSGAVTLGTVNIDITNVDDPMSLTGLASAVAFGENLVNAAPQRLDADVTFAHADNEVPGSVLTVSGLLAEDRVSLANGANVSLSGGVVYYDADGAGGAAAVAVGTATGGSGATFSITFNAAATVAAVDAVIQSLTYGNVSDTPTASRTLRINVTDSGGASFWPAPTVTQLTGASSLVTGMSGSDNSAPVFVDLDSDGDLDAVLATRYTIKYYENTGSATAPAFVDRSFTTTPFAGIPFGSNATATFGDLDHDGDLDMIIGRSATSLLYYENTGSASAPVFTARSGGESPVSGFTMASECKPLLADIDADGDLDLVVGGSDGALLFFENTGTTSAAAFTQRTGAASPFTGVSVGNNSAPTLVDVDGDGDLDLVVGSIAGALTYYENTGGAASAAFTQRTGSANPFAGVSAGVLTTPTFADLDGDGDGDLIVGERFGSLSYCSVTSATGPSVTVTVTAEAEGPGPGADVVAGTTGNDTVKGLGGDDVLAGGDGNDTVEGGDGDDTLTGGAGNDLLSGGVGADDMAGGLGDDIYVVNDAGDVVDETGGDGYDTVRASISYTLTADVERLELMFSGSINGTGNALANVIVGNGGANVLSGLAGNDTLTGLSGNDTLNGGDDDDSLDGGVGNDTLNGGAGVDTLIGGAGADRLDGGTGADSMTGGASNDTYVVDNPGDSITETSGGGTDTVEASIGYTLGSEVENLTLTGSSAINGTGNDLKNTLTGNGAANTLTGLAGADVLSGQGGDDRLIGGAGADSLTGGTGADTFVFSNADIGAKAEVDKILDLVFADGDVIDLSGIDANTNLANDQAFVFVTRFTKQAGQAVMTYANGITTLQLDVNGDGKVDYKLQITGDVTGTKTNLYTDGGGDTDGGWIL